MPYFDDLVADIRPFSDPTPTKTQRQRKLSWLRRTLSKAVERCQG
ncbi:hypothetical protein BLL52_2005 [Rhodoferax antarcticus ANT.BR]|uniref:Uncharacterized protein n=1 Tax=Rhodoferax antarcticus ANT.BR TaxID=1111071 RepID=A0A1Q8YD05_9BURK|nr:hypothetical protein BLL52_2005 [Rhodoferax antarcticus ANT.BR]